MPKEELKKEESEKKITFFELKQIILDLKKRVELLETLKQKEISDEKPVITILETAPVTVDSTATSYPIPMEYRMIVTDILGEDFGIIVTPMPDRPAFSFSIVVPERLNTLSAEEKKMQAQDVRTKTITYAEGLNGIRMWAEQIKANLAAKLKSEIK